jgi:hypothetical protein
LGYNSYELGELQQKILKHFFSCEEKAESVNHLSSVLNVVQPAVFKSVNLLIKDMYLVKDSKYKDGKKALFVTDKGAAAAVVLGVTYKQLQEYFKRLRQEHSSAAEQFRYLKKFDTLFRIPDKREFIVRKAFEYFLKNDWYDGSVFKYPDQNEFKLLLAYLSVEYNRSFGNVSTIKDIIDKYGLDKEFLRNRFKKDRERMDAIINELEG